MGRQNIRCRQAAQAARRAALRHSRVVLARRGFSPMFSAQDTPLGLPGLAAGKEHAF
jgi:hypothetical protein